MNIAQEEKLSQLRHSAAHLLAAAVLELYPEAKPTIGPSTDEGFYYDFDFGTVQISENDLPQIEKKMRFLVKSWGEFEGSEVSAEEALHTYRYNTYKTELVEEIVQSDAVLTFYKSGNFVDLCRGGHIEKPAANLKYFKLLSVAGAYWRGSEENKMLTRIYGTAFFSQADLDAYLKMKAEAKERDHRKLGQELDLFVFSDLVGRGLPLFTPKGTLLRDVLNDFSQRLRTKRGYQKVFIPHITKKELYETSGHWDKFGDELFLVTSQETSDEMVMKPMNCPHHQQIFASGQRSYRDLPIKYLETTTIYRDEKAGELLGLSRVRAVTQDDSHIFCTPDQIKQVYAECIAIIKEFYETIGMQYRARLSFMDPKNPQNYLGDIELWQRSQEILKEIAQEQGLEFYEALGEAAFYGPKIDFMVLDALGREWQLATPQLDFVQPRRFGLEYTDASGTQQTPVMIHFALMGSLERFLSVYIEHTAGKFPVWLAPVQVKILPISDKFVEYAQKVMVQLEQLDVRVELDDRSERLQAKIRDAQLEKVPYMLVVGEKEAEQGTVAVRSRDVREQASMPVSDFIAKITQEIAMKSY